MVARQYLADHATFVQTARMWTGARPLPPASLAGRAAAPSAARHRPCKPPSRMRRPTAAAPRAENFAHRSQAATEDEKVTRLADMGFSRVDAIAALQSTANDENAALELLLSAA